MRAAELLAERHINPEFSVVCAAKAFENIDCIIVSAAKQSTSEMFSVRRNRHFDEVNASRSRRVITRLFAVITRLFA